MARELELEQKRVKESMEQISLLRAFFEHAPLDMGVIRLVRPPLRLPLPFLSPSPLTLTARIFALSPLLAL